MKYNSEYFNNIFEPLGYYVLNRNLSGPDSEWFDLYMKDSPRGCEWFGSFSPVFIKYHEGNKKITEIDGYEISVPEGYDNMMYTPEEVINAINEYNKTRILPSYCYWPSCRPFVNVFDAFDWYMKTLGYEVPAWDEGYSSWASGNYKCRTMVYRNMYGEVISKITCYIDVRDDKEMKGSICRFIGKGWSWVESKYTGLNEMIAAINSIVEPETLINAANGLSTVNNMTDDRTDDISFTKVSKTGDYYTINAKNAVRSALQNALEKLN